MGDERERNELREALELADRIRFQLWRLVSRATVLGDEMDAPVKFPAEIAVTLSSMRTFIKEYDDARAALGATREEQT